MTQCRDCQCSPPPQKNSKGSFKICFKFCAQNLKPSFQKPFNLNIPTFERFLKGRFEILDPEFERFLKGRSEFLKFWEPQCIISSQTQYAMAPTPTQLSEFSECLKRIAGVDRVLSDPVGDLLGHWAMSSRQAGAQFARAIAIARPPAVRELVNSVLATFGKELYPPQGACELLLELKAPKHAGFRVLSQYLSCKREALVLQGFGGAGVVQGHDLGPFTIPRPICTENAFKAKWAELLAPMALDQYETTSNPPAVGISWPISSWAAYISSRPALSETIDLDPSGPTGGVLHLIVRGDGYPVGGTVFSNLTVGLANHGYDARRPAFVWPIGLAVCHDNHMDKLFELWAKNLKV